MKIFKPRHFARLIAAIIAIVCATTSSNAKLPESYAFNRGIEAYNAGNGQDALDWFNKEIQDHPDNGYAYVYISLLNYVYEKNGNALSAINNAIKKLPKKDKDYKAFSYATRGMIYLAMEDTVRALADYTQAIKNNPSNSKMYDSRAEIYYEQGRYDQADADYRKMIELDEGDVMGYMGIGRNANAQKHWDAAIEQFNNVIKLAPDYSSGYSFRADAYIGKELWDEAIDDIIKALSIDGDRKALYLTTQIDDSHFNTLKAKLKIQSAKEPNETLWPYVLGTVLQNKEQYLDAIAQYTAANKIDSNSIFYKKIADCYFYLGEYTNALRAVNHALQMDPDDANARILRESIYESQGEYDKAIEEMDNIIKDYPDSGIVYYYRGDVKMNKGNLNGAIDDYTTAIIIDPTDTNAYFMRGRAYIETGNEDLAHADFRKVIEMTQDSEEVTPLRMFAYYFLGDTDKAKEILEQMIDKGEYLSTTYYNAACLYSLMNLQETAVDYLRKAFEAGYNSVANIKSDYDFRNLQDNADFKILIEKYSNREESEKDNTARGVVVSEYEPATITSEVPFTKEYGITSVKCSINGLPLSFVFDTGAAEVTMSMVEANFMLKNGYLQPSDIIGAARYVDANGDVSEGTVINLRKVDFGGLELENVRASVVRNQKAPLLLGQSVLGRLGKIEIDNGKNVLKITHNK